VLDKAKWIKTILLDKETIELYRTNNFWPQRLQGCYKFFRPCKFYGTCGMSDQALLGTEEDWAVRMAEEEKKNYQFEFTIEDLIQQQLEG
jgi:hypothetical protein